MAYVLRVCLSCPIIFRGFAKQIRQAKTSLSKIPLFYTRNFGCAVYVYDTILDIIYLPT